MRRILTVLSAPASGALMEEHRGHHGPMFSCRYAPGMAQRFRTLRPTTSATALSYSPRLQPSAAALPTHTPCGAHVGFGKTFCVRWRDVRHRSRRCDNSDMASLSQGG